MNCKHEVEKPYIKETTKVEKPYNQRNYQIRLFIDTL